MTVLLLEGTARERGRTHGEELREGIREAVARREALVERWGQDPARRTEALATRAPYLATLERRCADLLDEVRGIAEGAAIPFAQALVLNLMDEEWWFADDEESGCSTLAGRLPGADDSPVLTQNMDLPAWMDGLQTVLRVRLPGESAEQERILLSAAGMIALTGMRRGGVAVSVNTLLQLPKSVHGLPVAFVLRSVLERPDAESAAGFLAALPHASGQHYAVVDDRSVFGLECSATGSSLRRFSEGEWLLHTNHPLWSDPAQVLPPEEVGIVGVRLHSSHRRLEALVDFAAEPSTEQGLRAVLADRGSGVCMTPSEECPLATFGSVEFRPGTGSARVLPGNHGEAEWVDLSA